MRCELRRKLPLGYRKSPRNRDTHKRLAPDAVGHPEAMPGFPVIA
jgi:hypothetical protein